MRGAPASWKTSASPVFATVRPPAPSASCRSPISGDLCVFVCGQSAIPCAVDVRLQILQIGLEAIEIDHRDGRLDLGQRAPDLRGEQFERAIGSGAHRAAA